MRLRIENPSLLSGNIEVFNFYMVDVVRENNREEIGESRIEREVMEKGGIMESKATEVMRERVKSRVREI